MIGAVRMKLVTFNIRLDWNRDSENNFCFRKPLILKKIRQESPDIICFQEVLPHVAHWLKESLPEYYIVGCPRGADLQDEQACIAYRATRFNLLKLDSYWLSHTPNIPGSRYPEQSPCPRICTQVTLQDLATGKVFRLANTHLDHEGHKARILGAKQIIERMKAEDFFSGAPAILVGDLNAEPDSIEIQYITNNFGLRNLAQDVGITYHGFHKVDMPAQIDYIFVTEEISCDTVEKWTDNVNGVYLSDHYPVCAEIIIN